MSATGTSTIDGPRRRLTEMRGPPAQGLPRFRRSLRQFRARRARATPAGGFTLLEILVVVLIIGIMVSFAVLSIGGRALDDRLEREARRVHQLLGLAAEQAVLQGTELGFLQTVTGYAFVALSPDGSWVPVTGSPTLRERAVADPFYLELRVEGRPVPPADGGEDGTELSPQVLLLSSGEATAFTLDVRARDHVPFYRVAGDLLGRMELERRRES